MCKLINSINLPLTAILTLTLFACESKAKNESIKSNLASSVTSTKKIDLPSDNEAVQQVEEKTTDEISGNEKPISPKDKEKTEVKTPVSTNKSIEQPEITSKDKAIVKPEILPEKIEEKTDELANLEPDATDVEEENPVTPVAETFSHAKFDALLKKNVSYTGKVNYTGFKGSTSFEAYLKELSSNEPKSSWSRNKKLAYWINAYNAFTIKLIIDNYPVKSIMDLHGGKPWDYKFIKIGSNTYSLNHIEHKIIRPVFNEPRIHFACVCAAKSCPKLANKAYTESNLNSLLTTQAKYFINNTSKNKITADQLKVSQLFNWYGSDFGNVHAYLAKYSTASINKDAKIEFMEYDWSLNN